MDSRAENTETFLVQLDSRDSVIVTDDTSIVNIEDNDGKQAIIFSRIKPSLYGNLHPRINLVMLTPSLKYMSIIIIIVDPGLSDIIITVEYSMGGWIKIQ